MVSLVIMRKEKYKKVPQLMENAEFRQTKEKTKRPVLVMLTVVFETTF